jgi:hypothetical protein
MHSHTRHERLHVFVQVRVNGKDLVGMSADDVVRLLDTAPVSEVAPIFACLPCVFVKLQRRRILFLCRFCNIPILANSSR